MELLVLSSQISNADGRVVQAVEGLFYSQSSVKIKGLCKLSARGEILKIITPRTVLDFDRNPAEYTEVKVYQNAGNDSCGQKSRNFHLSVGVGSSQN